MDLLECPLGSKPAFGVGLCVFVCVYPRAGKQLEEGLGSCLPAGNGVVRAAALLEGHGRTFLSKLL